MSSFVVLVLGWFFFFKQKTAYEMRISDWSSDVCSSDLLERRKIALNPKGRRQTKKRRPPIAMADWLHTVLVQTKAEQEERAQEMAEKTGKPLANCRTEYGVDHQIGRASWRERVVTHG